MAKREHGYVLDVKIFVPVDRKSLSDTRLKADAVEAAATANDLSGLVGQSDVMSVKHRWTSREAAVVEAAQEPTQAEVDAASAGQAGEVTVETVQPDVVDPQETGSAGEQQQDATEEAATGRRRSRAA
jgi:hypothetical protein